MKDIRGALFANAERIFERAEFAHKIVNSQTLGERCEALKAFYMHARAEILAKPDGWGIDPYEVWWADVFTPIEAAMWHELRRAGLVFYPQLPVGRAFVDFGNPFHKIAIECDGKAFHQDYLKDKARDVLLAERGWRVYRITGADCLDEPDEHDPGAGASTIRRFVLEMAARLAAKQGATA